MRYVYTLQKYKNNLQCRLNQKAALLDRYALKGYISRKVIDGREYKYLQYHNEYGELISVFLNNYNYQLYIETIKEREHIENRIRCISGVLAMLKNVPVSDDNDIELQTVSGKTYGFRLLDKSVGISNDYHVIFRIVPKEKLSEYEIIGTYKKKKYSVPMTYVNERMVGKIGQYIRYAGCAIDEAVRKDHPGEEERSLKKIYGCTCYGTKYIAYKNGDSYDVKFSYEQKPVTIKYKPQKEYDYLSKQIHQMYIDELVEDYINELKLGEVLRRLS